MVVAELVVVGVVVVVLGDAKMLFEVSLVKVDAEILFEASLVKVDAKSHWSKLMLSSVGQS